MQFVVFLVLLYGVLMLLTVGLGLGVGFVLRWLLPWLDKSMAFVIGVGATGFALHYMVQIITAIGALEDDETNWQLERKRDAIFKAIPSSRRKKRKPE